MLACLKRLALLAFLQGSQVAKSVCIAAQQERPGSATKIAARLGNLRRLVTAQCPTTMSLSFTLRNTQDACRRACVAAVVAPLAGLLVSTSAAHAQELPAPPAVAAADAEHALVAEALTVVDEHFIDLKNPKGVADSSQQHRFNGVDWKQLRLSEDSKRLKNRDASYKEINGALKKLGDKYTRFVKPADFAKLTKYDVTGVGVLIVEKEGQLFVGAPPLAGSTAAEADIQKGDRILAIDGVSMTDKSSFEGAEQLQAGGALGSKVVLSLERASQGNRRLEVALERRISVANPVSSSLVTAKNGHRVGYMKMTEFNAACKRGVAEAVRAFQASVCMCMYVHTYIHIRIRMRIRIHIHRHIHIHIHISLPRPSVLSRGVCAHVCIYAYITHTHTHTHIHLHLHMHMHMHIHTQMCVPGGRRRRLRP